MTGLARLSHLMMVTGLLFLHLTLMAKMMIYLALVWSSLSNSQIAILAQQNWFRQL